MSWSLSRRQQAFQAGGKVRVKVVKPKGWDRGKCAIADNTGPR